MKYFIALILFSACGQKQQRTPPYSLLHDKEKDQFDIAFVDKNGDATVVKINYENGTALFTTNSKGDTIAMEYALNLARYNGSIK